jgi:hypothetical protein
VFSPDGKRVVVADAPGARLLDVTLRKVMAPGHWFGAYMRARAPVTRKELEARFNKQ